MSLDEITEDESKDADGNKVDAKSLTRIRTRKDPVKPSSSSDTTTSSTIDHAVALGETKEDESKDADGKNVVTKSNSHQDRCWCGGISTYWATERNTWKL